MSGLLAFSGIYSEARNGQENKTESCFAPPLPRGMAQEQAAGELHITQATLSRIENLKIPYSQANLEAAAETYICEPGDLLSINPADHNPSHSRMDKFRRSNPDEQKAALDFIEFQRSRNL